MDVDEDGNIIGQVVIQDPKGEEEYDEFKERFDDDDDDDDK